MNESIRNAIFAMSGAAILAACAVTPKTESSRSLDLTNALLAKGGSVAILPPAKLKNQFPKREDIILEDGAAKRFRELGFKVVGSQKDANYSFVVSFNADPLAPSSFTAYGDTIYANRSVAYIVTGMFFGPDARGVKSKELWQGWSGAALGVRSNSEAAEKALVGHLMNLFPN